MKDYENQLDFLQELQKDKPKAYSHLYEMGYLQSLRFIKARGGSEEDIKDIFQEALIIFRAKIKEPGFRLQQQSRVQDYLLGIVKICWMRWCKQKGRELKEQQAIVPDEQITFLPEEEGNSLRIGLRKAMESLSQNCRKLLMDYYFGRFPLKSIAAEMDYSHSFVKVKKHRCMQELKDLVLQKMNNEIIKP